MRNLPFRINSKQQQTTNPVCSAAPLQRTASSDHLVVALALCREPEQRAPQGPTPRGWSPPAATPQRRPWCCSRRFGAASPRSTPCCATRASARLPDKGLVTQSARQMAAPRWPGPDATASSTSRRSSPARGRARHRRAGSRRWRRAAPSGGRSRRRRRGRAWRRFIVLICR